MENVVQAEFYEQLLEAAPDGLLVIDDDGVIVYVNRQTEELTGWRRDELIGRPIEMLLPAAVADAHPAHRRRYFADPRRRPMGAGLELALRRSDGSEQPVDISLSPLLIPEGKFVAAAIRDATDRKAAERELRAAYERLTATVAELEHHHRELTLINEMGELLQSCLDSDEARAVIARSASALFEGSAGAVYEPGAGQQRLTLVSTWGNTSPYQLAVIAAEDCWALRRGRVHAVWGPDGITCRHAAIDGATWSVCIPMIAQGEVLGLLHVRGPGGDATVGARSAAERLALALAEHLSLALANINLRETLRAQSVRDSLTGLYNRRFLDEHLEREILRASRTASSVGVLAIDLDHFKRFNDTHGHAAGDVLLRQVATLLLAGCRSVDLVCRQGGEEFIVILPDLGVHDCLHRAKELVARANHELIGDHDATGAGTTLSVGVAVYPDHGSSAADVLRAADLALYTAKADGRNRAVAAAA